MGDNLKEARDQLATAIAEVGKLEREVKILRAEKDSPHADAKYWAAWQRALAVNRDLTAERDSALAYQVETRELLESAYTKHGKDSDILFLARKAAERERDALLAQVAAVREALVDLQDGTFCSPMDPEDRDGAAAGAGWVLDNFLAQPPATSLTAHDAEVAAKALEEAESSRVEWAVEYVTTGAMPYAGYNRFLDRASCERFLENAPLWFDSTWMTNVGIRSRRAASEWTPVTPSTKEGTR